MIAKLTSGGFFKVIRMSTRLLYLGLPKRDKGRLGVPLVMLLLVIGCQQTGVGANRPVLPANADKASPKAELDEQLKINKSALLEGKSEPIRVAAATVMLFSENPLARGILLDALKQTQNRTARVAVCKALSQTAAQEPVENKEDFIRPLLDMLATDDAAIAKLAAEATLIFKYEQISKQLEKIVTGASLPARLNAIYALKLHPDVRAAVKLIELIDDPESKVAAASEKALYSLGIPVGRDAEERKQIIEELERKGPEVFLRDQLIRQETEMRKLETELNLWRGRYLSALGKRYDTISDDTAKGKFLAEHLGSSEAIVRLWALEKVAQRQRGTNPRLPAELGPILVNLISDQNRDVRLKTARLLSLMVELDSSQRLLAQLKSEQDEEVKMELFVALGGACSYAFSPNSPIKVPQETRKETLEWAVKYLFEQEPKKSQKGAEVMKKLLEQDGLTSADVDRYLGLLVERYNRQNSKADGALRGELLSAMAGLCAPGSTCKAKAAKLFKPLFEEALSDETDSVREAAVDGLIYIDKASALKRLRKDIYINDPSEILRKKLIELAGSDGGKEDLTWLAKKIGSNSESQPAWQAMLKIFGGCDSGVLNEWIEKFDSQSSKNNLSNGQKIAFLEIAERKAGGENKPKMLKNVREKLAELYTKIGQFERAADYLGRLHEAAQASKEKEAILSRLLDVYLRWPKLELMAKLVENCLLEKDLGPNSVVVRSIDNYLNNPPSGADPNAVVKALTEITVPQTRAKWQERLKQWTERPGKAEDSEKPREGGH